LYTVSQSQNGAELTQGSEDGQNVEQKAVDTKQTTDEVIENLVINKKWEEDAPKLKQEFETFIKEHGTKIELKKVDTTNWRTYTDKKRGFGFKYPQDWHVIPVDSSRSLIDSYSKKGQEREKKIMKQFSMDCQKTFTDPATIKGCAQPYPFLCVTDESSYENMPQKFKNKNSISEDSHEHCDILLKEYFPRLKSSKKSSGRMWLESYMAYSDFNDIKYIVDNETYLITSTTPTTAFNFLRSNGNFITVMDTNFGTPTITQTIKYTE
jgi:hypothetical protein